jgi:uncharacterized protein YgiB involved in biofilm formation
VSEFVPLMMGKVMSQKLRKLNKTKAHYQTTSLQRTTCRSIGAINKWRAVVVVLGKSVHLGYLNRTEEAKAEAIETFYEFAYEI